MVRAAGGVVRAAGGVVVSAAVADDGVGSGGGGGGDGLGQRSREVVAMHASCAALNRCV